MFFENQSLNKHTTIRPFQLVFRVRLWHLEVQQQFLILFDQSSLWHCSLPEIVKLKGYFRHLTKSRILLVLCIVKRLTNFLFCASLKASSPRSFCGTSFAFGISLDKKIRTFWSGSGGFISFEILKQNPGQNILHWPKKSQTKLH